VLPDAPDGQYFSIGLSVEGRSLDVVRFGNGEIHRLILAGIHGGYEWNTTKLAYQLIEHLKARPQEVPSDVTLYILPLYNPDGAARGKGPEGRANANNVDLCANFDAFWSAESGGAGCWSTLPITKGSAPDSEPETLALEWFLYQYRIEALISIHSAGLGLFAGGQPPDAASDSLAQALAAVSPYRYPPVYTGCVYTGQLIDWASLHGIAAVDLELSNHTDTDYDINLRVLQVFLAWRR
jgi:predicted deacylase